MNLPYFMHKGFRIYKPITRTDDTSSATCTETEVKPAAKSKKNKK